MTRPPDTAFEAALRRDRLAVLAALAAAIALAWAYLFAGAGTGMSASGMSHAAWTPGYAVLMCFMWWVMMIAMMLPGAAPVILLFATLSRQPRDAGHPRVATSLFALGYLAAWAGFSLVAVALQWGLERTAILSPMAGATDAVPAAFLLFAAGAYQLTPFKHSCLRHCRTPLAFLACHWRPGVRGALRMGFAHGAVCVGCCWILMGLMFVAGLMNLYWIAGLALLVLCEKTVPVGHWLGYASGVALLVWGGGTLAGIF
ncbi:DUF2182 domain-containing protein [Aromatoleum toluclasticum]|uniref:DUF2182 domain-containing protein n=1 Tax=Aromatoleum toluclasticum TaxID=92003 RepID=UPI000374E954|nr:DUF2182 domain-containing protein [Aromatoleum toluclasticum]